ncbi:MAG: sulfatase [Deltaproteobacteria bacterium]|nr:sulfatase [Deltaproteobacteria bacterium]
MPLLLLALSACLSGGEAPRPAPVEDGARLSLLGDIPFAALKLPPSSRAAPVPDAIPLRGWRKVGTVAGRATWEVALPVRLRSLFFSRPPAGMRVVRDDGVSVPHQREQDQTRADGATWTFTRETLALTWADDDGSPEGRLSLHYPEAVARERALNLSESGLTAEAFAKGQAQAGPLSLEGLLLPAPAMAAWELEVPPAAELLFRPGLIAPEVADQPPSDGATAHWEVEVGGVVQAVWEGALRQPPGALVRADLSAWTGQRVTLRVRIEPGATTSGDYAFFGAPRVASRRVNPTQAVVVFIDTLRADHLPLYGYDRDTAPLITELAQGAAVMEQARSVAPWTLPSTRTMLSGRYPDRWSDSPSIQERLQREGWATAMFGGNVYLSANFQMNRGWGYHRVVNWPLADEQVDQALAWLAEEDGHDSFMVLQFMDLHLPYQEPAAYRHRFAGDRPATISSDTFSRGAMNSPKLTLDDKQWVRDRYDNNIAYVNDQLGRMRDTLEQAEVLVVLADHGEEFWDHNGFEHGHTLFDELLHVPLVIRAPGVPPGRIAEPVSLLDLTPTLAALLDAPADPAADGRDLSPLLKRWADSPWERRDQAIGWPLYGSERWGVLSKGHKYGVFEGRESLWNLEEDPGEQRNLFRDVPGDVGADWRPALSAALGREVAVGYRLDMPREGVGSDPVIADLTLPGGVLAAWAGADPTEGTEVQVELDGEHVRVTWPAHGLGGREVFVIPVAPMAETTHALSVVARQGDEEARFTVSPLRDALPGKVRTPLGRTRIGATQVVLTYGVSPLPLAGPGLSGFSEEMRGELQALGYLGDD